MKCLKSKRWNLQTEEAKESQNETQNDEVYLKNNHAQLLKMKCSLLNKYLSKSKENQTGERRI